MKARFAIGVIVGVIVLGLSVGCDNSGPTAPREVNLDQPPPAVTSGPAPEATPTPRFGCRRVLCDD